MAVFCWSVYNGATYYIDVFGNRFQKELEKMKAEVARMNANDLTSPLMTPAVNGGQQLGHSGKEDAVDRIPLLDGQLSGSTGIDGGAKDVIAERKVGDLPK